MIQDFGRLPLRYYYVGLLDWPVVEQQQALSVDSVGGGDRQCSFLERESEGRVEEDE